MTGSTKNAPVKHTEAPAMKPMKIMDKAGIEKAIASIQRRGKSLDQDVQAAAVSTLAHIEKHGDDTLFNRLYMAMPKGARKNALGGWALYYGKLRIATPEEMKADKKEHKPERSFRYDRTASTDVPASMLVQWHAFKHSDAPAVEMFDVQVAIQRAVSSILAKATKLKAAGTKVAHEELIVKLAALAGQPSAVKV